jgi:hypothetical protein
VVGEHDIMGVAHLTLLPVAAIGVTALASAFPSWTVALRLAVVAGCCLDFGLGVYLQGRMESLENTARESVYGDLVYLGYGRFQTATTERGLSESAGVNWLFKHNRKLFLRWLDEMPRRYSRHILFLVNGGSSPTICGPASRRTPPIGAVGSSAMAASWNTSAIIWPAARGRSRGPPPASCLLCSAGARSFCSGRR